MANYYYFNRNPSDFKPFPDYNISTNQEQTNSTFDNFTDNYFPIHINHEIAEINKIFLKKKRLLASQNEDKDKELSEEDYFSSKMNIEENKDKMFLGNALNCFERNPASIIPQRTENFEKFEENYYWKNSPDDLLNLNPAIEPNEIDEEIIFYIKPKTPKFQTKTNRTPGRKRTKKKEEDDVKKIHSKMAFDNIITKVQIHFLNFLINLSNDIIKERIGKKKHLLFKDIDYRIKRNIKSDNLERFKKLKIKDFLQKPISKKFKSFNEDHNQNLYKKVANLSEISKEYFYMDYLNLFRIYYNDCKPLNKIIIKDKSIYLSEETKSFYYLIQKNISVKEEIIEFTKKVFLSNEG